MDALALIAEHTEMVKKIAGMFMRKLPSHVRFEDIYQAGMIGLWKATRDYNPTEGASFSTYAGIRIKGEIMDEIRAMSPLPRHGHEKYKQVEFNERDCDDIDQSIALHDPCKQLEKQQITQSLMHEIAKLPPRKARIFALFHSGLVRREIGDLFGVSESRISQLMTSTLGTLRRRLAAKYYPKQKVQCQLPPAKAGGLSNP
jgi:RNA polymerase sigma factor for flagellar operon FliA